MFVGDFNEAEASAVIVSWHIYRFNRQARRQNYGQILCAAVTVLGRVCFDHQDFVAFDTI